MEKIDYCIIAGIVIILLFLIYSIIIADIRWTFIIIICCITIAVCTAVDYITA